MPRQPLLCVVRHLPPSLGHRDSSYLTLEMTFLRSSSEIARYVNHQELCQWQCQWIWISHWCWGDRAISLTSLAGSFHITQKSLFPMEFSLWSQTQHDLPFVVSGTTHCFIAWRLFLVDWWNTGLLWSPLGRPWNSERRLRRMVWFPCLGTPVKHD